MSSLRISAACADLLSSSAKAVNPLSTRAPPSSSERIREYAGHGARIAPHIGAGTGLIEVEQRLGNSVGVERRALEIEGDEVDAAAFEGREERLLPFRVLEKDDEIARHG